MVDVFELWHHEAFVLIEGNKCITISGYKALEGHRLNGLHGIKSCPRPKRTEMTGRDMQI